MAASSWKASIATLYERLLTTRVSQIDAMLTQHAGHEAELFCAICTKHGVTEPELRAMGPTGDVEGLPLDRRTLVRQGINQLMHGAVELRKAADMLDSAQAAEMHDCVRSLEGAVARLKRLQTEVAGEDAGRERRVNDDVEETAAKADGATHGMDKAGSSTGPGAASGTDKLRKAMQAELTRATRYKSVAPEMFAELRAGTAPDDPKELLAMWDDVKYANEPAEKLPVDFATDLAGLIEMTRTWSFWSICSFVGVFVQQ